MMYISSTRAAASPQRAISARVTWLCWFALFAEGYDMGALGAVMPGLLSDRAWHLTPATAGLLGSAALVGMFFGAYLFGTVSDRSGRKRCLLICLALFSLASGCAAVAPTPTWFAVFRCISGLGIGGVVPVAAALTSEFAPPGQQNRQFALMYSGYSLGILGSAIASFLLLQSHGWRLVIGLGVLPVLLLPLIARLLPESVIYLRSCGREAEAAATAARFGIELPETIPTGQCPATNSARGLKALFASGVRRATIGFWIATFAAMVLVYGLNTWLPQIMRSAGYDLGPSILFLGVFALASSAGGIVLGFFADRVGRSRTITAAFLMGALAILSLAHAWPLTLTYSVVALAGIGSVSAAVMVTSYLASYFPPTLRATAVGCCLSFSRFGAVSGPMLGGLIASYKLHFEWNFVAFSSAALMAAAAILLVPTRGPMET